MAFIRIGAPAPAGPTATSLHEQALVRSARAGARARARLYRRERDELLNLGRALVETVPMTPEYLVTLRAFAQCVYRERQP